MYLEHEKYKWNTSSVFCDILDENKNRHYQGKCQFFIGLFGKCVSQGMASRQPNFSTFLT